MIKTLRMRLLLGLSPLLALIVGLGIYAIIVLDRLGGSIDVILKENYASVLAAENMKEALERMDSSFLFTIAGEETRGRAQFASAKPAFAKHLKIEQGNITLPGEQELADGIASSFEAYSKLADRFFAAERPEIRRALYFGELLPLFSRVKDRADKVLEINQQNMKSMDAKALSNAHISTRVMAGALAGCALLAGLASYGLSESIVGPIGAMTAAAKGMAKGDLDQIVPSKRNDELGELSAAFNAMARTIREFRQAGMARLVRARKSAQAAIDSFPDPVIVVDNNGKVERANPAATRLLGVTGGSDPPVPWSPPDKLAGALKEALAGGGDALPTTLEHAIMFRDDGRERYFLPRVMTIREEEGAPLGAAVSLAEVTRFRLLDQLKSDMVSTVSHELKTPLTSIRMTIHLLLEEIVGPLGPKQVELLLAARQDSERLLTMVDNLLDLTRIEQGAVALDLKPVAPAALAREALDRFTSRAGDKGVDLEAIIAPDLPPATADAERIAHVLDNLISNAIDHTERGGSARIRVSLDSPKTLRFAVGDTGVGIAPEHLPRIFDRFYRAGGMRNRSGAGLGLAIAREIIQAHGGTISATSEPGKGTEVAFTLPAASASVADATTRDRKGADS